MVRWVYFDRHHPITYTLLANAKFFTATKSIISTCIAVVRCSTVIDKEDAICSSHGLAGSRKARGGEKISCKTVACRMQCKFLNKTILE